MKTVFDLSRDEIVSLTCKEIYLYIDKELAGKGIPIEAKNWNIKNKKEVVYPRTGVPVFMLKDIGIGFRTIEGATDQRQGIEIRVQHKTRTFIQQ
jgi:hypothetical protein